MATQKPATIVENEEDAWTVLQGWLERDSAPEVDFKGWPRLHIVLSGEDYKSSLNSGQMSALINFKMTVGRAYCAVAHGTYDMRRLKVDEEEQLEFKTEVRPGSSIMDTDLSPLVQALASIATTHPGTSSIVGTLLGLAFISRPIILKYFENRAKEIDADERKRLVDLSLSAKEKDKHQVFEKSLQKLQQFHPQLAQALPDAQRAFWRLASASVNADKLQVAGLTLSQEDLELLSERRQRRPADVREVTHKFKVADVKKAQNTYRVQLESRHLVITAVYQRPHLTDAGIKRLINCMTSDIQVQAVLELRTVEGQVSGRLLQFAAVDVPDEA